jgi:hypothetical protein
MYLCDCHHVVVIIVGFQDSMHVSILAYLSRVGESNARCQNSDDWLELMLVKVQVCTNTSNF